jgi:predicted membrane protein
MTTYVACLSGWLAPLYGWNGHPLQMRYIEWLSATPIMLLCLAALGSTMQDELVQDWKLAFWTMFWDVVMVIYFSFMLLFHKYVFIIYNGTDQIWFTTG